MKKRASLLLLLTGALSFADPLTPAVPAGSGFTLMCQIRADRFPVSSTTKGPDFFELQHNGRAWFSAQARWNNPKEAQKESPARSRIGFWFRPADDKPGELYRSELIGTNEWVHLAITYNPQDSRAPLRLLLNGTLVYSYANTINTPELNELIRNPKLTDVTIRPQALQSEHIRQLAHQGSDSEYRTMRRFEQPGDQKALLQLENSERQKQYGLRYAEGESDIIYGELGTVPILLDINNDGLLDLFAAGTGGLSVYERTGPETFSPAQRYEPSYTGRNRADTHAASIRGNLPGVFDNDRWYPHFLETGYAASAPIAGLDVDKNASIFFADWNGDGFEDLVSIEKGKCIWFTNTSQSRRPILADKKTAKNTGGSTLKISTRAIPFDWDNDGDWDLVYIQNRDELWVYENEAAPNTFPVYAETPVRLVTESGQPFTYFSQNARLAAADWDNDEDIDLILSGQSGDFQWLENLNRKTPNQLPAWSVHQRFQKTGGVLTFGALATPSTGDLDGDGLDDIVCGNSDGFLCWFKNRSLSPTAPLEWAAAKPIISGGKPYRFMAGEKLSAQGAGERKYGYTVPTLADWDQDGLIDILLNTIAGKAMWLRNIGEKNAPAFSAAQPICVQWPDSPDAPPWNTWQPGPKDLPVQWRTSLDAIDWNRDGLLDLIIVDHEGYLAWLQRQKIDDQLILLPPERIFENTDTHFVYDYAHYREFKDENQDGINDFRLRDPQGALTYHFRDTSAKLGRDSRHRRYKFTLTENTADLDNPDRRDLTPLPSVTLDSYTPLSSEENRLLRLNAGWAGQSGRCKFDLTDWDGDGDLDLLVNYYPHGAALMENIQQTGNRAVFSDRGPILDLVCGAHSPCPVATDFNKDGIPDLLMGTEDGLLIYQPRSSFEDLPGRAPTWP
ncbi:FG-GAP repeat domain-containing protein [Tichowtungia aerotolerans]|uniref:VCBS repeat-containing protein n=1 Tax=Tichowtungia aerotolerans TaxID=2697043 RepID=A0A6P1MBH3_9BACT|nr:VCBS repeat-containing protein [Tichowtungia aerotolerans]QHI68916.1 hypothetical protein GT409_05455 [Tichowtungia aerotolerans]